MLVPIVVFTLFGIALGWGIWWTWRQRESAREQAELAGKQAKMNAELAVLGERVRTVAHDVDNLFAILISNLSSAHALPPNELREMLGDVERATSSASRMIRAMRSSQVGARGERSVEPIVQLVAALLERGEVPIDVELKGKLTYVGSEEDALRVVQNLVVNALREAKKIRGARLKIVVSDHELAVTNPTKNAAMLSREDLYQPNVSGSGSTGLGLAIARERAEAIGWRLTHVVNGDEVTFRLTEPSPKN